MQGTNGVLKTLILELYCESSANNYFCVSQDLSI